MECPEVKHHPYNTTTRTTLEWSGGWYCLQAEHHPCHTTHLDNLGVEKGGVYKGRQVKHLHAIPNRCGELAHLTGAAQDVGGVAQIVGVAAPAVHTVADCDCNLHIKKRKKKKKSTQ